MAEELVDIFDSSFNYLGTELKSKAHKKGLWHQSFHCWIVRSNGKVLLQLRSKDKDTYPNRLDISGAGHLSAGEKPEDGVRELEEELGIKVTPKDLNYLGYYNQVLDIPTKKGVFLNREFSHTFLLMDNTPLGDYIMQPEEVDGVFELDIQEGLKLFAGEIESTKIEGVYRDSEELVTKEVNFADFVPHPKHLWLKMFIMAERLLEGKKYLAV